MSQFCDIPILCIILFLFSTPSESLHPLRYRRERGNPEPWAQQLYEEPLYANANESVNVSPVRNIAIIGKLHSVYFSGQTRVSAGEFILTTQQAQESRALPSPMN